MANNEWRLRGSADNDFFKQQRGGRSFYHRVSGLVYAREGVPFNAQPGGAALLAASGLGAKLELGRGAPRRHREAAGSFADTECCA